MPRHVALYARCSTDLQTLDPQLDALRRYAENRPEPAQEYLDHGVSGAKDRRPGLDALMAACRRREVSAVVVVKLDRLARSVLHLTTLAKELDALGVALVILDQALDTGTPSGKLLLHVLAAIGEFERDLIRERTAAGLAAARRRGARLGRPKALDRRALARARRLRASGRSLREIAGMLGCGVATLHRALAS